MSRAASRRDPFAEDSSRGIRTVAIVVAVLVHVIPLLIYVDGTRDEGVPLRASTAPALKAYRPAPPPPRQRPKPVERIRQDLAPVPDFEPDLTEPVVEDEPLPQLDTPELTMDYIGNPTAPPSSAGTSSGSQPLSGSTEGLIPPRLIESTKILPVYPERPRKELIYGNVVIMAVVTKEGNVENIRVLREIPSELGFEREAVKALEQWKYIPATLHGVPVDVYVDVIINFDVSLL